VTPVARAAVAGASAAWGGVAGWWWAPVVVVAVSLWRRSVVGRAGRLVFAVAFVAGVAAGIIDSRPPAPLSAGPVVVEGRVEMELPAPWGGWSGVLSGADGSVLLRADAHPGVGRVRVTGESDGLSRRIAGRVMAATVDADRIESIGGGAVHERAADVLRRRIVAQLDPGSSEARGLLVGFLIGDTSGVGPVVEDEMRRSGLSHLVAVSGSNVALFLVALVVVTAPFSMRPTGRLFVIVNGLLVFGALTRWEPSVIRASAMAGVIGLGRFAGIPLEPITALALVTGGSVLVEPGLSRSLGFQLSVLATAGLIAAARCWPGGGAVARIFKATVAAQAAVAPLLLAVFGTVPLLSPVANLVAIPLVTVATALAGIGAALGLGVLVSLAEILAAGFIVVARIAAPWPQIGWVGFGLLAAVGFLWWRHPPLRRLSSVVGAVAIAVVLLSGGRAPDTGVVFLDVGQGDAIVVRMSGVTMLVDGGPDPARLVERLGRYGIRRIDIAVISHVHSDHAAGVAGIIGRIPIGRIWVAFEPHVTTASESVLERAADLGIPVQTPSVGARLTVGGDVVEVIGPRRRYDGPNDQSIVLVATLSGHRILLSGDIETVAQSELHVPRVDILKVPHQGGATSHASWLRSHSGRIAVISVGSNDFGHPVPWVIDTLEDAGALVYRTDRDGDIVVAFDSGGPVVSPSHPGGE